VLLTACASNDDPRTDPAKLERVEWVLDAASMGSLVDHVPHDARIDLQFQDGETRGKAACNSYGGSYEATSDGDVTFGQIASTAMACLDDDLMTLESAYLGTLKAS